MPRATRTLLILCGLLLASSVASARTEVLRWTHPSPNEVLRFEALVRTSSQSFGSPVSLGLPQADSQSIFTASIDVADDTNVFVAVRAVGTSGVNSDLSNERYRPAPNSGDSASATVPVSVPGLENGVEIPPDPGALVRFDFDSGVAADWLDTGANNSMVRDDSLFSVSSVGGNPALTTSASANNFHSHFIGSPRSLSNLVLTGRMAVETTSGGVGVTAYSQYPTSDTYYRLRTSGVNNDFEFVGHPYPTSSCSGTTSTGVTAEANVWYQFELTISNEGSANRISALVWRQGDPRPTTNQIECLDSASDRPMSGTIGVWSHGSGARYWDDLEVVSISGNVAAPLEPVEPPVLISIQPVQ